jgi:periplasmic protein TonB
MAYLDKGRSRPNPASISAALAVNGLMAAAIIYSVPDILPRPAWAILETYRVPPDPAPTTPVTRKKPPASVPDDRAIAPWNPPVDQQNERTRLIKEGNELGTPGGTGAGIVDPPLLPVEPIFKGAQINPRYIGALQPVYPPGMIREEREGAVKIRVLIGTDGRVKDVQTLQADDPAFLEATRKQALSKWRFLPATRDGEPVESWRDMTVRFQLPS